MFLSSHPGLITARFLESNNHLHGMNITTSSWLRQHKKQLILTISNKLINIEIKYVSSIIMEKVTELLLSLLNSRNLQCEASSTDGEVTKEYKATYSRLNQEISC